MYSILYTMVSKEFVSALNESISRSLGTSLITYHIQSDYNL